MRWVWWEVGDRVWWTVPLLVRGYLACTSRAEQVLMEPEGCLESLE